MFKSSFPLWQPLALMVVLLTLLMVVLTQVFESQLRQQHRERLLQLAQLGAGLVHHAVQAGSEPTPGLLTRLLEGSQARLQILDDSGRVLLDSRRDGSVATQPVSVVPPEVSQALAGGIGYDLRSEANVGRVYFLALSLPLIDRVRVIRIAEPEAVLTGWLMTLRFWALLIWMLGLFIVLGVWRWLRLTLEMGRRDAAASQEVQVVARTRDLAMLQRLGSLMSACTTVGSACKVMEPIAEQLLPGARGSIALIRSSRGLELVTQWGGSWPGAIRFGAEECWALLKGNTHLSRDEGVEIQCDHQTQPGSQLCIPLLAQGEALGVFSLMFTDEGQMLAARSVAESMAEQVGLALANIRLRDNLKEQAIRDPLSGLFNRRHMMEFLESQLALSQRRQEPLSILMLDIDHFKNFNDSFGHDAGDFVILRVAKELTELVRKSDLVCRYGGEEMVVICPGTDLAGALDLANKLVVSVAALEFSHNGQDLGRVTLSAGVSCSHGDPISMEALMKAADEALYRAKRCGRNRVEAPEGAVPPPLRLSTPTLPAQTKEPG
ncbi:diguanylate cyclase [Ferrimonas sediminicola]|uniref:diguanylate cyclase n=1 Tax=Ferrimonas sediminicola TaxID=2569538 RepID=A0A4U1BBH4_9GAMM|nr:diguanylate cyclase [Ferrimonas sediminicola]TKB47944.1 diguanylate cyclase [Ferrimonas sediminicola]